jgi:hypothetical protein
LIPFSDFTELHDLFEEDKLMNSFSPLGISLMCPPARPTLMTLVLSPLHFSHWSGMNFASAPDDSSAGLLEQPAVVDDDIVKVLDHFF